MLSRICLIFVLTMGQLQGGDLYSILLCDTYASNIEDSIKIDLKNIRNEVTRIQWYTQLRLIEVNFNGVDLVPSDVFQYVLDAEFNPDDVVIFFFTGHGYRTPSKRGNPWPNLYCSITGEGIDFYEITQLLAAKNPGLLVSMCDCCNNILPDSVAPDLYSKEYISESVDAQLRQNYQSLFLQTTGVIMVRSSDVGEYSWCNSKGAIYLLAFLDSLQSHTRNNTNVTWENILNSAASKVIKLQTPVHELDIVAE